MGCCISHPSGPNSPYPGGGPDPSPSARAINGGPAPQSVTTTTGGGPALQATPSPTSVTTPTTSSHPRRGPRLRHHSDQPLDQHINKPLRRHEWISDSARWTPRSLRRERADFFDTRVTGRQEIWQALRAALELMWEADTTARDGRVRQQQAEEIEGAINVEGADNTNNHSSGEEDRAAALATAQTILTAAEITLPTGDLADGAYDSFGNYYAFPEHVVSDPINVCLAEKADVTTCGDVKGEDLTAGEETAEEEEADDDDDEVAIRRREEKGKAVVDMRDQVPLRARLSEGDRDVTLHVGRGESVRSVSRRIAEEALLPATKKVRLAYMGKMLKESSSLLGQGWKQGHVVNALVFSR